MYYKCKLTDDVKEKGRNAPLQIRATCPVWRGYAYVPLGKLIHWMIVDWNVPFSQTPGLNKQPSHLSCVIGC